MSTVTVVSLNQIRAALDSDTTNAHAQVMAILEKPLLQEALIKTRGNQTLAAQLLGLNRGTLRSKLKNYDLMK